MSTAPDPLAQLRARTADALHELREIRCHDPAAASAMRVVRLTARTLDSFWLPALDGLGPDIEPDDRDDPDDPDGHA